MKITDIKQQVRQKDRFSVFISGKYAFSLSRTQLQDSVLKIGSELSPSELKDWQKQSTQGKLLDKALRWLAIRPRSTWELQDYLRRNQVDKAEAKVVIDKIMSYGYIDDLKFAQSWVGSRRALKAVSIRRLRQELAQKHVASEIIKQVLAEDQTDELTVLRELIERKQHQSRYADKEKLIAYLARQGFSYSDIKEALASSDSE